ncbi:hypothetical protein EBAPG3_013695 [Nitrosospira lacus]|uniref:Uncharacterized protein n=1 Tax=Nitrosospira lacus TaxID=1288494 RepID=A0A1W6SSG8_9PROT|nr:hypothetical protein [Nitrosospira lacus]ARO88733.3 hypothetical protein EBAPG3_013695 [Nitrosospira lacus]
MTIQKRKYPRQQQTHPGGRKRTGDVAQQKPLAPEQKEGDLLLPHDRDETTGPVSTASATAHQESRDTLKQAVKDIERGLKDTERRGIPSDVPSGTGKKQG